MGAGAGFGDVWNTSAQRFYPIHGIYRAFHTWQLGAPGIQFSSNACTGMALVSHLSKVGVPAIRLYLLYHRLIGLAGGKGILSYRRQRSSLWFGNPPVFYRD